MKNELMQIKGELKRIKEARIYINEYLPTIIQEKRRKEKEVQQKAETSNPKCNVEYVKGKMTIQGERYQQKISVPTPKDLIDVDIQRLKKVQALKLAKGAVIKQSGSIFQAFCGQVNNYQDIRDLYIRMKINHPYARHIPCAYWLKGEAEIHYNQDYIDDGEPGSGKVLMQVLTNLGESGQVIFAVRKYGGTKLGTERFTCYEKSVASALGADPEIYVQENLARLMKKRQEKMEKAEGANGVPKKGAIPSAGATTSLPCE